MNWPAPSSSWTSAEMERHMDCTADDCTCDDAAPHCVCAVKGGEG